LSATFVGNSFTAPFIQALKRGALNMGFKHSKFAPPCHIHDVAGLPIADVLVEAEGALEHAVREVATRAL
jgi:hypothetical protein